MPLGAIVGSRLVRDVISGQSIVVLPPDATAREAARLMATRHVAAIIVATDSRMLGIFTERDAVCRVITPGLDADAVTLAEVMTKTVVTTTADTPISRVLRMMYENNFRHVPVLDRLGTPIGIISIRDALGDGGLRHPQDRGAGDEPGL